jgi:type I restriction enzyme S subunit
MKKNWFCFMYGYLKSERFLKHLLKEATGSIQKNFCPTNLDKMKDAFPPDRVAELYRQKTNSIISKFLLMKEENTELIKLRDFLLPLLMNGQVKVKSEAKEQLSMAAEPQVKYGK